MDERPYGCSRRAGIGCLAIFALIVGCIGTFMIGVDAGCYGAMTRKIPIYPGARVISQHYNLFRAFGMGETLVLIETDDDVETVRNWYGRTVGEVYRAVQQGKGDAFFFLGEGR